MKGKQKLRQAIDFLYSCGCATSEAYTRIVIDCVRSNDIYQAKRLQAHMERHLFQPTDAFVHNQFLHMYAKFGKLSDAQNLFDKMTKKDIYSWNAILSAYAKLGLVEDLCILFDQMPYRDSVSYNTIIASLTNNGRSGKALEALAQMKKDGIEPTEYTYVSALQACSHLLDFRLGKQIHGRVIVGNSTQNVYVCNSIIDMYANCGDIGRARKLFDGMVVKNVVSWNLMISVYVKNRNPDECIHLFDKMQLSGFKPDQITVSNVLNAYFQCGCVDDAKKMFHKIMKKDEICWTTMLVGYAQNGREEDALMLFCDMLHENIQPDSFTISSVVSSCAKLASLYQGQVVHGKAILMGVDDNMLVSSALVDMYCKCGVTSDAWVIFEAMPTRNVVTWNAMIRGYARNGQGSEAVALYESMLQEKLKPDNFTFVGVLSACINADMVEQGQRYFDSIIEHGMTPTLDHYAYMITLLGRSGYISEAVDLIKVMPHKPDYLIWSTLLSVCTAKCDIKHAELAARHLFELDPLNAGPYIIISNMYAACGRWKDVAAIRSLMKRNNAKKFAAYSWIEIENEVHKFVSEDRSHPEVEKIYSELTGLIAKLWEFGYNPDTKIVLHDVGEEEKVRSISYHSEKLALAFALMRKPHGVAPIRIIKNIRVCDDCHAFMKSVSLMIGRPIILRDSNRFHHFIGGSCSCKDHW
ncbi:pentatricopeptide repeat-containing protein At4g02750-like [Prosopis cineraria]|uniref:pentatricopeptide repeat-containing protein At4g02750-like n=1 Tax=Prosopis cineraria TaxID=364024 RepID=UPI00240ED3CA|nr:pentatricopeptide repeat-containing protein At4g02750-like [Prosopis cineraria]XP_054801378.1 pentatricopeptide repeat-containing protein At4g02750-like [Prosopis cineraria]